MHTRSRELPHLVREPEAGHLDRLAEALVLHRLGGGSDADGGRRHDQLEIGIAVDQSECLVVRLVGVVVAVDRVDELQVGVLVVGCQCFLHGGDPGVLVGGIGGRGQDRELTAVVTEDVEGHVGHHDTGFVEVDLGDEQALALAGRDR